VNGSAVAARLATVVKNLHTNIAQRASSISPAAPSHGRCPISGADWSVVLAGGEGQRMRQFIRHWLGEERPKQYCTFVGKRSMLEHTWGRALAVAMPERVVTVVGNGHLRFLDDRRGAAPGPVLEQPRNCGTAPGVLLPATLVAARDPGATLLILPADHFVHPESRFLAIANAACRAARERPGRLILLGVRADEPETDFGWILPAAGDPRAGLAPVERFEEKPDRDRALRFLARGGLWNTMVMAVRVGTLWALAERHLPAMVRQFRELRQIFAHPQGELPEVRVAEAVERAYRHMPEADFSRDLVQRCPEAALVLSLDGVEWSDWGRPERVAASLQRLGKLPSFAPPAVEGRASGAARSRASARQEPLLAV
jgi:mannose-1-phosphate guanylyltransferase